jgi:hypothetical protein
MTTWLGLVLLEIGFLAGGSTRGEAPFPRKLPDPYGKGRGAWARQIVRDGGRICFGHLVDLQGDQDLDIVRPRTYRTGSLGIWEKQAMRRALPLDRWTYIQIDDRRPKWGDYDAPDWLKYFGLAMADLNSDGHLDIVAGRHFYRNPGATMTGRWQRVDFGKNVDAMLVVDADGDRQADVIATALPDVYWLEAEDPQAERWRLTKIGSLPKTGHVNGQGYMLGQIVAGGKPEVILACGDGTYYFEIPESPQARDWPKTRIAPGVMDEGIGVGDLDGDGDMDIAVGKETEDQYTVMWWANPGDGQTDWTPQRVGPTNFAPDRIVLADINRDGRCDVVVSEERYPGPDPDASLYWFEQTTERGDGRWTRHTVVTEYSLNNLDVADMDGDGDMDIVTCEHKGPPGSQKLQIFENRGRGQFTEHLIDRGKESHLGARVADLDADGDLDMISVGWDEPQFVHLWRNDAITAEQPEQP